LPLYWPEVQQHIATISAAVESALPASFQEIPMLTRKEFLRLVRKSPNESKKAALQSQVRPPGTSA
jgi:hypothetical protein